jgi:hypothetical protein
VITTLYLSRFSTEPCRSLKSKLEEKNIFRRLCKSRLRLISKSLAITKREPLRLRRPELMLKCLTELRPYPLSTRESLLALVLL